jgi:hypothetical protein
VECNGKLRETSCYQRQNNGFHPYHHGGIPGVFNCRFSNPVASAAATKRKKKKPTSFVPPPVVTTIPSMGVVLQQHHQQQHQNMIQDAFSSNLALQVQSAVPFWRRPLPSQHNHQVCFLHFALSCLLFICSAVLGKI